MSVSGSAKPLPPKRGRLASSKSKPTTQRRQPSSRLQKPRDVIVDSREPKSTDLKLQEVGFVVDRKALETGDFVWVSSKGEVVGVERKTASDFLQSLTDKQANGRTRFQNQMGRMLTTYSQPVLLIEGKLSPMPDGFTIAETRMTTWWWASVDNIFLSAQRSGILVAHCGRGQVASRLVTLVQYFDKPQHTLIKTGED